MGHGPGTLLRAVWSMSGASPRSQMDRDLGTRRVSEQRHCPLSFAPSHCRQKQGFATPSPVSQAKRGLAIDLLFQLISVF